MMTLHPEILVRNGKKKFAVLPYEEFLAVKERLADAEDLLELRKAKPNGQKSWSWALSRTFDETPDRVLRPICDAVWQACGLYRSFNFEEDSQFKPQRW